MQQLHSHSIKSALEKKVAAIGIRSERLRNLADKPFPKAMLPQFINQVEARNSLALRWPLLLTSGSGSIFPNLDNKKKCARKSQQMCVLHEKPSQSTFWAHILVKPAQPGASCVIYIGADSDLFGAILHTLLLSVYNWAVAQKNFSPVFTFEGLLGVICIYCVKQTFGYKSPWTSL